MTAPVAVQPAPVPPPPIGTPGVATSGRRPPRVGVLSWVGVAVIAAFVLLAVLAPVLTGFRPIELAGEPLESPSATHPLGTNLVGQDVASQMLHGTRVSLFIAVAAGLGTVLIGALVGVVAGWAGGMTDAVLMRVVDLVLVVPSLPLLIVLGAYAGPSLYTIALVIAVVSWPPSARVVRAQVLSLRERAHLQAATALGGGTVHVLRRHVVPEVGLILAATLVGAASRAVMMEAGLAFLGLGDPTRSSWGGVMRDALAFDALFDTSAWQWWLLPPAVAVTLLLLGMTFVGIGVEQRINPRLSRHVDGSRR